MKTRISLIIKNLNFMYLLMKNLSKNKKSQIKRQVLIFITACLWVSCSPWSRETQQALKMAGENKAELEKVLEYYSQNEGDSLDRKSVV